MIAVNSKPSPTTFETFAEEMENIFLAKSFDLIVCDLEPISWQSVMRWPAVRRLLVTNVFLAQPEVRTVQKMRFAAQKVEINAVRRKKGLVELQSHEQLYDADEVLLSDPQQVVRQFAPQKNNYQACGACYWQLQGALPTELSDQYNILLASMGSTGRSEIHPELMTAIADFCDARSLVYVGPSAPDLNALNIPSFAYERLPVMSLFDRTAMAITQGGSGSTYQALSFGIPVIVVPTNRNHEVLGEQLELLGVAVVIGSDDLPTKLNEFDLKDLQKNAQALALKMQTENGPANMAQRILKWLN